MNQKTVVIDHEGRVETLVNTIVQSMTDEEARNYVAIDLYDRMNRMTLSEFLEYEQIVVQENFTENGLDTPQ